MMMKHIKYKNQIFPIHAHTLWERLACTCQCNNEDGRGAFKSTCALWKIAQRSNLLPRQSIIIPKHFFVLLFINQTWNVFDPKFYFRFVSRKRSEFILASIYIKQTPIGVIDVIFIIVCMIGKIALIALIKMYSLNAHGNRKTLIFTRARL